MSKNTQSSVLGDNYNNESDRKENNDHDKKLNLNENETVKSPAAKKLKTSAPDVDINENLKPDETSPSNMEDSLPCCSNDVKVEIEDKCCIKYLLIGHLFLKL